MRLLTILTLATLATTANALDLQGLANQAMSNPQVQQTVSQKMGTAATTTAASKLALSNPCGTSTGAGSLASLVALSQLSPQAGATGGSVSKLAGALNPSEQSALLQFALSPEGQSIMAKLPTLMQQYGPTLAKMYGAQ